MRLIAFALCFNLLFANLGQHSLFVGIGGGVGDYISQDKSIFNAPLRHDPSLIWGLEGGYVYRPLPFVATRLYLESKSTLIAINLVAEQIQFSLNSDIAFKLVQPRNDRSFSVFLGLGFGVIKVPRIQSAEKSIFDLKIQDIFQTQKIPYTPFRPIGFTNVGVIFQINESEEVKVAMKTPVDLENNDGVIVNVSGTFIHHF